LGHFYSDYYAQNAWTVNQRTGTSVDLEDINTWDARRLAEEAVRCFKLSLQEPEILKTVSILDYKDVLSNTDDVDYQPALFDFVANQALAQLSSDFCLHSLSQDVFVINDPRYFENAQSFLNLNISSEDELSPACLSLKIYQDLIKLHTVRKNSKALVYADLRRLSYLHENGRYDNNDKMYENALITASKDYKDISSNALVLHALASYYINKAGSWQNTRNNEVKDFYVKALQLSNSILKDYPKQLDKEANALTAKINQKELSVKIETVQLPGAPFLVNVQYRNIEKLNVSLYKLTKQQAVDYNFMYRIEELKDFISKLPAPGKKVIALPPHDDFQTYTADVKFDGMDKGAYLILISNDSEPLTSDVFSRNLLQVSSLAAQSHWLDNVFKVLVTERSSGKPVAKAGISIYDHNKKSFSSGVSTKEGITSLNISTDRNKNYYSVEYQGDELYVFGYEYGNDTYEEEAQDRAVIFTDRAIYRPGQTVFYKALLYHVTAKDKKVILTDKPVSVRLRDVNRQVIAEKKLTSNEFGSIEGHFSIPQGLLNGSMTLECENYGSTGIEVEEYKRPAFEVKFDPVKGNFALNRDVEVSLSATALAGYPVDNAKVQYHVVRRAELRYRYWWLWYPEVISGDREIASGLLQTDDEGNVTIGFTALADDVKNDNLIYTYTVTADVTDLNGETHSATASVRIGKNPLLIATNMPSRVLQKNSAGYTIGTTNLNGDPTESTLQVRISALETPGGILRKRLWQLPGEYIGNNDFQKDFPLDEFNDNLNPSKYRETGVVADFTVETKDREPLNLSSLTKAGWYKVVFSARSKDGIAVADTQYIQYLHNSPAPINRMEDWYTPVKVEGEPGEDIEVWIAGGEENSSVYFELIHRDKVVESKWLTVGTTPSVFKYPVKEKYRGGFMLQYRMVQNNRLYTQTQPVEAPYTDKMLDVRLTTFRDKLLPGENEKWTMLVAGKNGEKETAEIAASLYDASLDAFALHSWADLNTFYNQYFNTYDFRWNNNNIGIVQSPATMSDKYLSSWNYSVNLIQLNLFDRLYMNAFYSGSRPVLLRKSYAGDLVLEESVVAYAAVPELSESKAMPASPRTDAGAINKAKTPERATAVDLTNVATRTNFNETAFFYPQLRTNGKGEVLIEFTIPEALTKWKLLSFAHTKDLKIGTYTNELITQKQVAVSANAPRFFRENDKIAFTAKVNNITGGDLSGKALLQLFDAVTMQPVDALIKSEKQPSFNIKAGGSAAVRWTLEIPAGLLQALTYKVTAQAGTHTDGEEKTVPVLTNSMLVTESAPFSVRAGREKTVLLERLAGNKSATLRNHSLTLEYTSAPAWYALQALPYMMEYPYECAEQTFSRYYANTLAATIVNKTPEIKKIFELWNAIPGSKALLSALEKNQELKQVMLEETPWVMQAKGETERKKRIGLLFDFNRMSSELNRAFNKLKKVQNGDGGFPWFEGNPSSRYITQHIVAGIAHLDKLGALQENHRDDAVFMVKQGLMFLDRSVYEDYEDLLKRKVDLEKNNINAIHLHYLYAGSFTKHKPGNRKHIEAFDYYLAQTKNHWTSFSAYEKAMAALILNRHDDKKTAGDILKSLKEHAVETEEMGMYWKDNTAGYFWYQAPVETQALLIETFAEVANDTNSVEEMKIWLLRNKQTNDWKTTKATSEAIYALLMTGSNLLDQSTPLDVRIAGRPLDEVVNEPIKPEPGTGYVKTSWNGSEITGDMARLTVKNPNKNGIAWGGLYWQYFEQLDKITSTETSLKISKQLFLRTFTNKGEVLQPLNENNKLKVGDLLRVRMELRAGRDYEYVHLKDMRASALEPVSVVSQHRYQDGLSYYESVKDASTNFFITYLRKGTYVFEYDLRVSHAGDFSNGITTFQCMYAPEYSAHSEGIRVVIVE
jgi:uncharacterized protein YfaS (alpha-2-macroglobulin family)